MKITRQTSKKSTGRNGAPVILFAVGSQTFVIGANEVDEIRDLHGLKTLRSGMSKVKSTLVRERKTYFVVDAAYQFNMLPSKPTRVLILRNSRAAVAVDSIDRMMEISAVTPLPQAFQGEERRWYRGLTLIGEQVVPVVNAAVFLSNSEASALERQLKGNEA